MKGLKVDAIVPWEVGIISCTWIYFNNFRC